HDNVPIPQSLTDRLVRRHLSPLSVYGETEPLQRREVSAAELHLMVDSVSPSVVRLRLDGHAVLGKEPPAGANAGRKAWIDQWGYRPKLLGFLEYDPRTRVFSRFDVVALGDHFGRLGICDSAARPGLQPLGIAFEMVKGNRSADRVPPG